MTTPYVCRFSLLVALIAACSSPAVEKSQPPGPLGGGPGGVVPLQLPDGGGGTTMVDAAGGNLFQGQNGCNKLDVKFDRAVPTVAVVVDRSSSMFASYGSENRWNALKKALIDPQIGLIKRNQAEIRFGLFLYTSQATANSCPVMAKVDFTIGNFAQIESLYGPAQPPPAGGMDKGETPTGEALENVIATLSAVPEPGPKFILLVSDGEPDTCPGTCVGNDCPVPDRPGWPRDPSCGQDRSIAAVQNAFGKGIRTSVLGIGNDLGTEHLQSLANAGAGVPVVLGRQANWLLNSCRLPRDKWKGTYAETSDRNAPYYNPADAAGLATDLKTILDGVRSCSFTLKGTVDVARASQGQVMLDNQPLIYADPNGWKLNGPSTLELVGNACRALQASARLQVAFPCQVFKPIE